MGYKPHIAAKSLPRCQDDGAPRFRLRGGTVNAVNGGRRRNRGARNKGPSSEHEASDPAKTGAEAGKSGDFDRFGGFLLVDFMRAKLIWIGYR